MEYIVIDGKKYVDTTEAAKKLNVGPKFVADLCRKGELSAIKAGQEWRVELRHLEAYVTEKTVPPGWLTLAEAGERLNREHSILQYRCIKGTLDCRKIRNKWYVNPEAVEWECKIQAEIGRGEWLNAKQMAKQAHVTPSFIAKRCGEERIPCVKFLNKYYVAKADVEAFILARNSRAVMVTSDMQRYTIMAIQARQARGDLSPSSAKSYMGAVNRFCTRTGTSPDDLAALMTYVPTVSPSEAHHLKQGLKSLLDVLVAREVDALDVNGVDIQERMAQLNAKREKVARLLDVFPKGQRKTTKRKATWLTKLQIMDLLAACPMDLDGYADYVLLAVAVGTGMRRRELADFRWDMLRDVPLPDGSVRLVADIIGKGAKDRTIPVSPVLAEILDGWGEVAGREGTVLRNLLYGKWGPLLYDAIGLHVARAGRRIGIRLSPHDCRRTFAQAGQDAGMDLLRISLELGHANLETTRIYLNVDQDFSQAVGDFALSNIVMRKGR